MNAADGRAGKGIAPGRITTTFAIAACALTLLSGTSADARDAFGADVVEATQVELHDGACVEACGRDLRACVRKADEPCETACRCLKDGCGDNGRACTACHRRTRPLVRPCMHVFAACKKRC